LSTIPSNSSSQLLTLVKELFDVFAHPGATSHTRGGHHHQNPTRSAPDGQLPPQQKRYSPPPVIPSSESTGSGGSYDLSDLYSPSSGSYSPSSGTDNGPPPPGSAPPELFPSGKPSVQDVNQRQIGDCSLDAQLASLAANNPGAITNMIRSSPSGGYDVSLYVNGQKQAVHVDASDINAKGTVSKDGKTDWASVIEAAVTKTLPDHFAKGQSGEAMMEMLTGRKGSESGMSAGPGGVADMIQKSLASGGLVSASASHDGATSNGQKIVGDHDYSVLGIQNGMVTVRNPWGQGQANGGIIQMSIDDFTKVFDNVQHQ
jgi:hypothetical protein